MQHRDINDARDQSPVPWSIVLGRTLQELDGAGWGEPAFGSHLVTTCHALRHKPVGTLTDEELRMAIGQGIGLEWLVRLAIDRLKEDPLLSGDYHEGDLLKQVMGVPIDFWAMHPVEREALDAIFEKLADDPQLNDVLEELRQAISVYQVKR